MAIIKVNGESQELNGTPSILEVIKQNNVLQPDMVSVQVNGEFVHKDNFAATTLKDGDEIDFLYFMGGGQ
ncbi:MAG: sulfur carrier protein ThiS [Rikenellaceae bacterium]|nr:sulfur carrier protein ThiS [Rikenellaceae bacterium]